MKLHFLNLHWYIANVNFLVDFAHNHRDLFLVDSKDAKAIKRKGVARGGKTWCNVETYDHDFPEVSTNNAVTPMSHLFVETVITSTVTKPLTDYLTYDEIGVTIPSNKQQTLL